MARVKVACGAGGEDERVGGGCCGTAVAAKGARRYLSVGHFGGLGVGSLGRLREPCPGRRYVLHLGEGGVRNCVRPNGRV